MTEPLDLDALRADLADTVACLKNERQRASELLRERDAIIARLSAPTSADVVMLARKIALGLRGVIVAGEVKAIARALQQYGDERAAAATRDERGRCFTWAIGRVPRSRAAMAIKDGEAPGTLQRDPSVCWVCGEPLHPGHFCPGMTSHRALATNAKSAPDP